MNLRKIASVFLAVAFLIISSCVITACTDNDKANDSSLVFKDIAFQELIASAFEKVPSELKRDDLDNIVGIDVYYYSDRINDSDNSFQYKDIWSITLYKKGYHEAYEAYYAVSKEEREALISPYEFAYTSKLDTFNGYSDLINFKNLRSITFDSEYKIIEINPLSFIAHLRSLETLSVYNYAVPNLSIVPNFSNLKSLSIGVNLGQIGENQKMGFINDITPLSSLKKLEALSLTGTSFTSFAPISKLDNLKSLTVSMGGLTDISSVSELNSLEYVNFYYNGISDVTPLTKLPSLKKIILDYNHISDISPFSALNPSVVEYVSLDMNSIEDITPLKHLGEEKVYVGYDLYWD